MSTLVNKGEGGRKSRKSCQRSLRMPPIKIHWIVSKNLKFSNFLLYGLKRREVSGYLDKFGNFQRKPLRGEFEIFVLKCLSYYVSLKNRYLFENVQTHELF